MHVASAVVIMVMEMPAFPNQFHAEQTAENDQHDADDAFCRRRKRLWDRHAKHEDDRSHEEQDGRADEQVARQPVPALGFQTNPSSVVCALPSASAGEAFPVSTCFQPSSIAFCTAAPLSGDGIGVA